MQATTTPLHGLTVAVTGSRRAKELAQLISNFGGNPYIAPTVAIEASGERATKIRQFVTETIERKFDFILFMTGPGIQAVIDEAKNLGAEKNLIEALKQIRIIARSSKPRHVLSKHGIAKNVSLPVHETAEACFELLMRQNLTNKHVAVCWHGTDSPTIVANLKAAGAEVFEVSAYKYSGRFDENGARILQTLGYDYVQPSEQRILTLIADTINGKIDVITFTSPPAARRLFETAENHNLTEQLRAALQTHTVTVAIGPTTKQTLQQNGVDVKVIPETYKLGPMVTALVHYLEQSGSGQRAAVPSELAKAE